MPKLCSDACNVCAVPARRSRHRTTCPWPRRSLMSSRRPRLHAPTAEQPLGPPSAPAFASPCGPLQGRSSPAHVPAHVARVLIHTGPATSGCLMAHGLFHAFGPAAEVEAAALQPSWLYTESAVRARPVYAAQAINGARAALPECAAQASNGARAALPVCAAQAGNGARVALPEGAGGTTRGREGASNPSTPACNPSFHFSGMHSTLPGMPSIPLAAIHRLQ